MPGRHIYRVYKVDMTDMYRSIISTVTEKDTLLTTLARSITDSTAERLAVRVTTLVRRPSLDRLTNERLAVRVTTLVRRPSLDHHRLDRRTASGEGHHPRSTTLAGQINE